jgi:hypothetical protein
MGKSAIFFFHFSHHETNTSLKFHMWQAKMSEKKFHLSRGVAVGIWMKFEAQLAQPC